MTPAKKIISAITSNPVIPAQAGIQETPAEALLWNTQPPFLNESEAISSIAVVVWIPACAGMTASGMARR